MSGASDKAGLPDWVTTDEFADLLHFDVDYARHTIRKHKDILQPFKLGRETRMKRENVLLFVSLLEQGKIR